MSRLIATAKILACMWHCGVERKTGLFTSISCLTCGWMDFFLRGEKFKINFDKNRLWWWLPDPLERSRRKVNMWSTCLENFWWCDCVNTKLAQSFFFYGPAQTLTALRLWETLEGNSNSANRFSATNFHRNVPRKVCCCWQKPALAFIC